VCSSDLAANGTKNVTANIGDLRQAAQNAGQAAGEVLHAAGELAKNGEMLRAGVRSFLESVRK
jgi:methyl-accepting chemotaxis protein